jgi:transposase
VPAYVQRSKPPAPTCSDPGLGPAEPDPGLPPYSPDFNPIENAFAKLKALLRKAAERSVDGLWAAIGAAVSAFSSQECANYFTTAGYDTDAA